jgi:tRNA-splicing ligase RtcB (3'-phosphate/5'-hydroxy nucleic acid ligase)
MSAMQKTPAPAARVRKALEDRGIVVRCASAGELAEGVPHAYKDVDRVVEVVHQAGLARKVARLVPLGVVKGYALLRNDGSLTVAEPEAGDRLPWRG